MIHKHDLDEQLIQAISDPFYGGDRDYIRMLLKAGANPNARDDDGATAMMLAAAIGNDERIIDDLASAGADPNLKDNRGYTALIYCTLAQCNYVPSMLALLCAGADVNEQNNEGNTALVAAVEEARSYSGKQILVYMLLESGADPTLRNNENKTVLDIDLAGNDIVRKLIECFIV
jgi:ankyrin repeat protein